MPAPEGARGSHRAREWAAFLTTGRQWGQGAETTRPASDWAGVSSLTPLAPSPSPRPQQCWLYAKHSPGLTEEAGEQDSVSALARWNLTQETVCPKHSDIQDRKELGMHSGGGI